MVRVYAWIQELQWHPQSNAPSRQRIQSYFTHRGTDYYQVFWCLEEKKGRNMFSWTLKQSGIFQKHPKDLKTERGYKQETMRWILFEDLIVWHTPQDIESCATDVDKLHSSRSAYKITLVGENNFCPRTCNEYGELYMRIPQTAATARHCIQAKLLFSGPLFTVFDG
jgi:hypothetical protein